MPSRSFRLEPLPGYAPTIGRLVGILLYARQTTLAAVEGLSIAELDHLQDDASNSIGALLAHIAAVERGYQCVTFEERAPSALEQAAWEPALTLGAEGRRLLRNEPLEHYVHELSEVRRLTLECLAALSRSLARESKFPPRPVEVSRKGVMLARPKLGQQLPDDLLHLSESVK